MHLFSVSYTCTELIILWTPKCSKCNGSGKTTCVGKLADNLAGVTHGKSCILCNGTGMYMCSHCNGTGNEPQE